MNNTELVGEYYDAHALCNRISNYSGRNEATHTMLQRAFADHYDLSYEDKSMEINLRADTLSDFVNAIIIETFDDIDYYRIADSDIATKLAREEFDTISFDIVGVSQDYVKENDKMFEFDLQFWQKENYDYFRVGCFYELRTSDFSDYHYQRDRLRDMRKYNA